MTPLFTQNSQHRLTQWLDAITNSEQFKSWNQIIYLTHYVCLSIYATGNLFFLLHVVVMFPPGAALMLAGTGIICAMVNEIINMKTITNPDAHQHVKKSTISPSRTAYALGLFAWLFALLDNFFANWNMVKIQASLFEKSGLYLPLMPLQIYQNLLTLTGLIASAMTFAKNWLCFLNPAQAQAGKPKKLANRASHLEPETSQLDHYLASFIKNPISLGGGIAIGGLLYAYGDFQQLVGILYLLQSSYTIALTPTSILCMGLLSAAITFIDRTLIWGYNYSRFADEHRACFPEPSQPFRNIPMNTHLRAGFSNLRLFVNTVRNIAGVSCAMQGPFKYISLMTTCASVATTYVQNSFQISVRSRELTKSRSKPIQPTPTENGNGNVKKSALLIECRIILDNAPLA